MKSPSDAIVTAPTTPKLSANALRVLEARYCATENLKQGGKRRGANMSVLRVDHPDHASRCDPEECRV